MSSWHYTVAWVSGLPSLERHPILREGHARVEVGGPNGCTPMPLELVNRDADRAIELERWDLELRHRHLLEQLEVLTRKREQLARTAWLPHRLYQPEPDGPHFCAQCGERWSTPPDTRVCWGQP